METQKRLDLIVMEKCGFSREYARDVIQAGLVSACGKTVKKPGAKLEAAEVTVSAPEMKFVGRGGYKLEAALDKFGLDVRGLRCVDIGASSGGFTDCLLQRGASIVYAVDVGRGQLAEKLRNDARVVSLEKTDVRNLTLESPVDFAVADVSFISLTKIIPSIAGLVKNGGHAVLLIKPEFEAGRGFHNKKGVVTGEKDRARSVENVKKSLLENGFECLRLIASPIAGRDGNIEYLVTARKR